MCAAQPLSDDAPLLRLRGTRLDYLAAANAMARGRPAAEVALAAGSRARSRRNLRVVGLRIEARLLRREVLQDLCAEVGLTLDTVLHKLKALLDAEKLLCVGRVEGRALTIPVPDHRAQLQAVALLIRILGIHKLPVLCEPPTHIEALFCSRPAEDWERVAELSPAQFECFMRLAEMSEIAKDEASERPAVCC